MKTKKDKSKYKILKKRFKLEVYRAVIRRRMNQICKFTNQFTITIASILLLLVLMITHVKDYILQITNIADYFIACAAILGTIFALIITLAIIPIQYATGLMTTEIASVYFKDRRTRLVLVFTGCNVILLLALSLLPTPPVNRFVLLCLLFLLTGISLDLIRFYYQNVLRQLDPSSAVKIYAKDVHSYIKKLHKFFLHKASKTYSSLPNEDRENMTEEQIQAEYYNINPHLNKIMRSIEQLAEACRKGISRGDVYLSKNIIGEMVLIVDSYLINRQANLLFSLDLSTGLPLPKSDSDSFLNRTYDTLLGLSKHAILNNNEEVAVKVIEAFSLIATSTSKISLPKEPHKLPLSFMPISYMMLCVDFSREKGFTETGFQVFKYLKGAFVNWPNGKEIWHPLSPALKGWQTESIWYLTKGDIALVNSITEDIFTIVFSMQIRKHFEFEFMLREVMRALESLVPISIQLASQVNINNFLSKPYDVLSSSSFTQMIINSANAAKIDETRKWVNPYSDFIKLNSYIRQHFSEIAKSDGFDKSFLFWQVMLSIENIMNAYYQLLDGGLTDNPEFKQDLAENAKDYISVFGWAAHKSKFKNSQYYNHAADLISCIGLQFGSRDYIDTLIKSAKQLGQLMNYYIKNKEHIDTFFIADIKVYVLKLQIYLEELDKKRVAILNSICELPDSISDELKGEISKNFELRKKQFEKELERFDIRNEVYNKSTGLLATLLRRN